jgi:hypothetical protein
VQIYKQNGQQRIHIYMQHCGLYNHI